MVNLKHLTITGTNCTNQQAISIISSFTEKELHRTRSHGAWFEIKNTSYFIKTLHAGGEHEKVNVNCSGKSLNRNERMFYKT